MEFFILTNYNFDIKFVKSERNIADFLSRIDDQFNEESNSVNKYSLCA